jgi:hypothetical protein
MNPKPKKQICLAAALIIGIFIGAAFVGLYNNATAENNSPKLCLNQLYLNAIEDAMIANEDEIINNLTQITQNNSNLTWKDGKVLMVTWTKYADSYPAGQNVTTSWGDVWVSVVPEIQVFFKNHADQNTNLTLRTQQLLGLPTSAADSVFVELWVNPSDLFRPAPDNEINDTAASLDFPADVSLEYKVWFNNNIISSYYPMKYPWTRLGYTYDWGSQNHVGLSEFVIKQNSTVTVKSVTPTQEYLKGNN